MQGMVRFTDRREAFYPLGTKPLDKKMDKAGKKTLAKKENFFEKRLAFPCMVWYYN